MDTTAPYTTLAAWPLAICRALEARGIDPDPILAQVRLTREDFINDPDGRVDVRLMTDFWDRVLEITGDDGFGLEVASHVQPMHFRALGLLMQTTGNLEDALLKLGRYSALVSNSAHIRIERQPSSLGFCIDPIPGVSISAMAIDSFMATSTCFAGRHGAQAPFVDGVELMRARPLSTQPWLNVFGRNVTFGAQQNALWLNRARLQNAVILGDAHLSAYNESIVKSYLEALEKEPLSHRVKQLLLSRMENGTPSAATVAQHLQLTERSLRRHLSTEGTTYRDLLHQCRMERAEQYMRHTSIPVTDVALRVGFSDSSNFSRAFARHFGSSPSEFRNQTPIN